jgi:arylsulfatase A-like enzyme
MSKVRNVLFIMADQLRADYLSCAGHPSLQTPNIDWLAAKGVSFDRAYVQSPVCGPSRMSFYTGRYAFNHGASWNFVPLPVGETTLGDYLRPNGIRTALVGKTHMRPDLDGMARLGLDPGCDLGILAGECGFEPYERDDGEHPDFQAKDNPDFSYNVYLRARGYDEANPWHSAANSTAGADGEILSGWDMRNAKYPARVEEAHSETAYTTDRALDFMREQGEDPWCLHLSYIKPHWPYIVPAPYHDMYGQDDRLPLHRADAERNDPHPVYRAFMEMDPGVSFSREEVCATVIPTYMGLVKQIDDHLGRLFRYLEETGRLDDTMIVFTSDHGDFLGDHWLGEKELFFEESARVPMIVYDPDQAADKTRGTVDTRFVEAIDLVPTFVEAFGLEPASHVIEGRSLLPLVRGETVSDWRDAVFCELDFAFYRARLDLKLGPNDCRMFMVRDDRWKYIHHEHFRPQLYDLENDPDEFVDLGGDPAYAPIRQEMADRLFAWFRGHKRRLAMPDDVVVQRTDGARNVGVIIGRW